MSEERFTSHEVHDLILSPVSPASSTSDLDLQQSDSVTRSRSRGKRESRSRSRGERESRSRSCSSERLGHETAANLQEYDRSRSFEMGSRTLESRSRSRSSQSVGSNGSRSDQEGFGYRSVEAVEDENQSYVRAVGGDNLPTPASNVDRPERRYSSTSNVEADDVRCRSRSSSGSRDYPYDEDQDLPTTPIVVDETSSNDQASDEEHHPADTAPDGADLIEVAPFLRGQKVLCRMGSTYQPGTILDVEPPRELRIVVDGIMRDFDFNAAESTSPDVIFDLVPSGIYQGARVCGLLAGGTRFHVGTVVESRRDEEECLVRFERDGFDPGLIQRVATSCLRMLEPLTKSLQLGRLERSNTDRGSADQGKKKKVPTATLR